MIPFLLLLLSMPSSDSQLFQVELDIHRDEPNNTCRNGGILSHGECHCPFPHTGATCQDFDCQNGGISVGKRYDPNSFLFSKPCLCKDGFKGELCQYRLENRCGGRGEWKDGKCRCIDFFFGDYCQFTSNCVFGIIKHGRCICKKGYEGSHCQKIVCYHGYTDVRNQSQSCVCPAKYKGLHCDECAQVGHHIAKYPICVYSKPLKTFRKKNTQQAMSRFTIMVICGVFLLTILIIMYGIHLYKQSRKNPEEEEMRMRELNERKRMLTEAAMQPDPEPEEEQNKGRRKISFVNLFRRKQSSDERKASMFRSLRYKRQQSVPSGICEELQ